MKHRAVRGGQARENKEMEGRRIGLPLCCDSGFCGRMDGLRRATAAYDSPSLRETEMRRTQTKINAFESLVLVVVFVDLPLGPRVLADRAREVGLARAVARASLRA